MPDAATLPGDMLAPVNSLMGDYRDIKSQFKQASKDEQAAGKEKDAAIVAQRTEIDKERGELHDLEKTMPHPHIEPWTQKPPENNPLQRFGSWASAFGILAGAITKTGLASSLNASAAAMNAFRQNDLDAYDKAHQAWKENTEIAVKNAEWEYKGYQNAFEMMKTNQALGQASALTIASQAENHAAMAAAKMGDLSKLWNISEGMARFAQEGPKVQWELGKIAEKNRRLIQLNGEWMAAHPGHKEPPPEVQMANRVKVEREAQIEKPLTPAERVKLTDRKTSYEQAFDDIDFVKNNLDALSVGFAGRFGRAAEDIGEILKFTDSDMRNRITGALERIKQHYPNLTTGTTRQITAQENARLEKIIGGQYTGSTVINTTGLLNDLEDSLMKGYATTQQELGGAAAADTAGAPSPGTEPPPKEGSGVEVGTPGTDKDGNKREFTGGDVNDIKNWKIVEPAKAKEKPDNTRDTISGAD